MTKHHLVQIAPVAVRARFCESDRLSAGRVKSLTPARTRLHYPRTLINLPILIPTTPPCIYQTHLHDWSPTTLSESPSWNVEDVNIPEMHRLDPNRTIPHPCKRPLIRRSRSCRIGSLVPTSCWLPKVCAREPRALEKAETDAR